MPRTAARSTQADIARAIRAIQQTGAVMDVVLERDGSIRLVRRTEEPVTFHDPSASIAEDLVEIEL